MPRLPRLHLPGLPRQDQAVQHGVRPQAAGDEEVGAEVSDEAWLPIVYADGALGRVVAPTEKYARLTVELTKDGLKWRRVMPGVAALLKRIAWKGDGQERGMTCPACDALEYSGDEFQVHAPDCELAALLKECDS